MQEWKDIGEELKAERERKGLDLKSVNEATRIPIDTLKALESSDYSIFPNPTYARSFLSQYRDHLGVDAHDFVDAFETGNVISHSSSSITNIVHSSSPPSNKQVDSHQQPTNKTGLWQALIVIIITLLLIIGGVYLYKNMEKHFNSEPPTNTPS